MAYISQRAQIKEGIDYYIGSYKAARKLTESLKNKLGGMINESPRLMGRDKSAGKDLYRVWILLRLPHFLKGDFVKYNDLPNQVTGYDGSKIYLKDLESQRGYRYPGSPLGNWKWWPGKTKSNQSWSHLKHQNPSRFYTPKLTNRWISPSTRTLPPSPLEKR